MTPRASRSLGALDWRIARYLFACEGLTYSEAARRLNIRQSALRMRAIREGWFGDDDQADDRPDELISVHIDRHLMSVLTALDTMLIAAPGDNRADRVAQALREAALAGALARSSQSVARAHRVRAQIQSQSTQARPAARASIPSVEETIAILKARAALRAASKASSET
jgi:hypothetical protein